MVQALLGVPGIAELLEGLTAYTQNHYTRLGRLQRSAYLLDYTLASMNVLLPPGGDAGGAEFDAGGDGFAAGDHLGVGDGDMDDALPNGAAELDAPPSPATPPQAGPKSDAGGAASGAMEQAGPSTEGGAGADAAPAGDSGAAPAADAGAASPEAVAEQAAKGAKQQAKSRKKQAAKKRRKSQAAAAAADALPAVAAAPSTMPRAKKAKRSNV